VGIIGAGPAGLMLSHLLYQADIESVVLEQRSRVHVESRIRAGVCEQSTVDLLREVGLAERLDREGMPHHGFSFRFDREDHRIALTDLTGRSITVYGQQEIVKDLIAQGGDIRFGVSDVAVHDIETDRPWISYDDEELHCDVIVGCDGFHGVARGAMPAVQTFEHTYPYAWLGVLAKAEPSHHELIYAAHERGFALHSMRSPEVTRLYLQVDAGERIEDWSDDRIWDELHLRLAADDFTLQEGPLLEKGITPMRAFVAEPMRHGRLFLAGDAAHIVPPTGAKGMNLAIADVLILSRALTALLNDDRQDLVESYSDTCLRRVWRAEQFSNLMTTMLHRPPGEDGFGHRLRMSQLRYTASSQAAATSIAENYVGLPF
jgi:p-hydroxybenzoate 3-monooxygenase